MQWVYGPARDSDSKLKADRTIHLWKHLDDLQRGEEADALGAGSARKHDIENSGYTEPPHRDQEGARIWLELAEEELQPDQVDILETSKWEWN